MGSDALEISSVTNSYLKILACFGDFNPEYGVLMKLDKPRLVGRAEQGGIQLLLTSGGVCPESAL
jgi:hypothetical protein